MPLRFYTLYEQKFSNLRPLLSITFPKGFRKSKKIGHWTLGKGEKNVKRSEKHPYQKKSCSIWQNSLKNKLFLPGDFTPFIGKSFQIWDYFFILLFPKDSESLKFLDIRLQEVGAKRHSNGSSKVNRHTNTLTDRQTYGQIDL